MPLVITNIPKNLRTPDLRNYFSEYIERKAFTCFHFRHRPQTQLRQMLKLSLQTDDDAGGTISQNDDQETISDGVNKTDANRTINQNYNKKTISDSATPIKNTCQSNESLRKNHSDLDCSEADQENKLKERDTDDGALEDSNIQHKESKSHWLSSGLSGLSSLINEKKEKVKAMPKIIHQSLNSQTINTTKTGQTVKPSCSAGNPGECSNEAEILQLLLRPECEGRTCCVVEVKDGHSTGFIRRYHRKHWLDRTGEVLLSRCLIFNVDFDTTVQKDSGDYMTRKQYDSASLFPNRLLDLLEFRPPPLMPEGNVGTPTTHFKQLIRSCQLPGVIIKKLGLEFPKTTGKKRFSQVPFNYGTRVVKGKEIDEDDPAITFTASGHLIPSTVDFKRPLKKLMKRMKRPHMELEKEGEDGAEVEEWERYEPFHEDVTSQDRIKERRFEEELEVTWEKGGSGLVFYTDAQYWRAQQGDFDEQTADEWDVDMSVYYQKGSGDKDAQDSLGMMESDQLRSGRLTQSAFNNNKQQTKKKTKIGPAEPPRIGEFEAHTRGVGRRLMEAQGWQEGQGLGRTIPGLPYALDNEGQHPRDKKGFGYHGEKLQGWGVSRAESNTQQRQQSRQGPHLISTAYDPPDPPPPPLRTKETTTIKHRHNHITFTKQT